jgi:glycosyltransferase involved in cell wall biosynthesis
MKLPLVSTIVPIYNGETYIANTIESILLQTYSNTEIVIVNDGSKDRSYQMLEPYLTFSRVKYIEQENRGVAAARNTGIRNSSGELIAFLDQDDLWLPEKIEKQVKILLTHPEIALVHGKFNFINETGSKIEPLWRQRVTSGFCYPQIFEHNKIGMLTALVRRECIEEAGLFDEDIAVTDDYLMWLKITYRHQIYYYDEPLAEYRYHSNNTSRDMVKYKKNELEVIMRILNLFPETYKLVGQRTVNDRLYYISMELASLCWRKGSWNEYMNYSMFAFRFSPTRYLMNLPRKLGADCYHMMKKAIYAK